MMNTMETFGEIENTILIEEIKMNPCLYDKDCTTYNDKAAKQNAWDTVCSRTVSEWYELSSSEQKNVCQLIQKRWRSIRDSFLKYYKLYSNNENIFKKRRKYVYHKQLQFMIPVFRRSLNEDIPDYLEEDDNSITVPEQITPSSSSPKCDDQTRRPLKRKRVHPGKLENRVKYIINKHNASLQKEKHEKNEDSDRMFLLSLLPLFKQLNQQEKVAVQIDMLQSIQKFLSNQDFEQDQEKPNVEEIYLENQVI